MARGLPLFVCLGAAVLTSACGKAEGEGSKCVAHVGISWESV